LKTTFRICFIFIVIWIASGSRSILAQSDYNRQENLPYYDQRAFHYGILLGLHASLPKIEYSEVFLDSANIHSITPKSSPGFSLGGIINFRLNEYLDARLTPTVGFYEYKVDYNYVNQPKITQSVSSTNVELPLLLKFKSERRKNIRMYFIGGGKISFEASGRKDEDEAEAQLRIKENSLSLEYGVGLDVYYPLFKFSPEIRFSHGLSNVFQPEDHRFSSSLQSFKVNTISLFIIFQ
jgi:hypothetical protein